MREHRIMKGLDPNGITAWVEPVIDQGDDRGDGDTDIDMEALLS